MAEIGAEECGGGGGSGMRRHQRMHHGKRRRHGQAVEQQGALGFPRQIPHQRDHHHESDFEKQREAHQERGDQDGPCGAVRAELQEQPIGQRASAAGVFEEAADHGAESHHHRDKAECAAESGFDGFQNFVGRHSGGEPECHAGDDERQKGVQFGHQDQEQQGGDGGGGEDDEDSPVGGH